MNKSVLELGAGSGLISFVAVQKGAIVTGSHINLKVIENLQFNMTQNQLKLEAVLSDLFDSMPDNQYFDYILINPPYYPKKPLTIDEKAWFCGSKFEYFTKMFAQLHSRKFGNAVMILSEDCEINTIQQIGLQAGIQMQLEQKEKIFWEWNFIFKLSKTGEKSY